MARKCRDRGLIPSCHQSAASVADGVYTLVEATGSGVQYTLQATAQ